MHFVSHMRAFVYGICHIYCRQMRAYAWNGTHLTNIDCGRARDSELHAEKIFASIA